MGIEGKLDYTRTALGLVEGMSREEVARRLMERDGVVNGLKGDLAETLEDLAIANRDLEGLRVCMGSLRDSLTEFRQDKEDLQLRLTETLDNLMVANKRHDELRAGMAGLRDSLGVVHRERRALEEVLLSLRGNLEWSRKERERLAGDVQKAEAALAFETRDRGEMINKLVEEKEKMEAERDNLRIEVHNIEDSLLRQTVEVGARVLDLEAQLKDKDERLSRALDAVERDHIAKVELRSEVVILQLKVEDLQDKLAQAEELVVTREVADTMERNVLQAKVSRLSDELVAKVQERDELWSQLGKGTEQCEGLKKESAEWERLYHCQAQETRSLRAELRTSRDVWLKTDVELMNLKMDTQDGKA